MSEGTILFLPDDKRAILARAGRTFPGEKLNEVVTRTLSEISKKQLPVEFYEIRRVDVPWAFDALLKLQNTGSAQRYIETDEEEFREVLRVEVTLLDTVLLLLALLLDVISGIFAPAVGDGGMPPANVNTSYQAIPESKAYMPKWKREPQRMGYEGPGL
jgi:hypothetical protein